MRQLIFPEWTVQLWSDSCPPRPISLSETSARTINHYIGWIKLIASWSSSNHEFTLPHSDRHSQTFSIKNFAHELRTEHKEFTKTKISFWEEVGWVLGLVKFTLCLCDDLTNCRVFSFWPCMRGNMGVAVLVVLVMWVLLNTNQPATPTVASLANSPVSFVSNWIQQVDSLDETSQDGG